MKTFVLVHGAWHGGWCWSKVGAILRGRGHQVFAPTQTGLGERSHLLSKSIDVNTFIDDIANVIQWENLHDVVLVGHSFGGMSITGVADRMPERLRQLIYLDAIILENGQSGFSKLAPEVAQARLDAAEQSSSGLSLPAPNASAFGVTDPQDAAWIESKLTPHPLATYTSTLWLNNKVGNGVPTVYIHCTDPGYATLQGGRDWVNAAGWKIVALKTGHDAMVTAPDLLADMLDQLSSR